MTGVDPTKTRAVAVAWHASPLLACRFDPTGRYLFAAAQDNAILRWDLVTTQKRVLAGHRSWVRGLAFRPGVLYSADYTGKVLVWPTEGDAPVQTIDAHRGWARAVAVSPDGRTLATCGNDRLVKLWTADGQPLRTLIGHEHHVYNVAFHPAGELIASADLRGIVKVWAVADGREVRSFHATDVLWRHDTTFRADHGGVRSMTFNHDGTLLACAGIANVTNAFAGIGNPVVVLFDAATGQRKQVLRPAADFRGTAWGVDFDRTGLVVGVAGGNGGALYFWRPAQSAAFHTVALPNNARDLHLHPDGRRFAIASFDGALRVYDMGA